MSEPTEDTPLEAAPPAKGASKIMPIILVANTLMITGVLIFVMKRPSAQAAGDKEHAASAEHGEKEEKGGHGDKSEKSEKHGEKEEKSGHGEKSKGEGHGEGEGDSDGLGPILKLEAFVVQIRADEGDRYAHMTLEFELGSEGDKKYFDSRMPHIRDTVIGYLSDRTEDEMRGSEGLGQVKDALAKKIDEIVPGHRLHGMFITEFIIQ